MADPSASAEEFEDKVAYFQAVTGIHDPDLCTEILSAHNWDLETAVSSMTSSSPSSPPAQPLAPPDPDRHPSFEFEGSASRSDQQLVRQNHPGSPGIAWKLVTLPFYVIAGGLGLVSGAIGIGVWIAGGILSRSLGVLGLHRPHGDSSTSSSVSSLVPPRSPSAVEAAGFVAAFEREYGYGARPNFVAEGFMEALQRSTREYKLLFVYLHSPEHSDTPGFCTRCLCADQVATFVNDNFVAWGGSIRGSEGFKMSNSLKASRFPFCAVVMPAANQRIVLLQQMEGPKTSQEMLTVLQRVVEESSTVLVTARVEAEERLNNIRLREEQDAAFRAALEADQARERQRKDEEERFEREAAEAARKHREEEEARERAAREAAEKEAAIARRRQEKAMSLDAEPEKGPDVTQVLVRFPNGERKERRFHSTATIRSLYDFVDTLDCLNAEKYCFVSNFPRVSYGPDKHALSLKEAGLHPQVLVRFPNGERKERRFHSTATIRSLYDFVDTLDCLNAEKYCFVSNFPRVSYGPDKHALSLKEAGLHPQVLVRFPNGERKERRFHSTATIRSLYDFVDTLDCLNAEKYCFVSNFPRVSYGPDKHALSLKEAGLHPQASLFVEIE